MRNYTADNFDAIFHALVEDLFYSTECCPRGQKIREILAPTLRLVNPRARLLSSPARDANYRFAVGEFLWYARGARDVESIAYYNPRMSQWSDDGLTLNSAYGAILAPQWSSLVETLRRDPDSRRAVATIYSGDYLTRETKDVPCTTSLQFFIREGRLHLHVVMRANDVIWGLTNDLFSFTLIQELFLLSMRRIYPALVLGDYYHTAGSMHLYERHFEMAEAIIAERVVSLLRPPMLPIDDTVKHLATDSETLRRNPGRSLDTRHYHGGVAWMAAKLNEHRAIVDARK